MNKPKVTIINQNNSFASPVVVELNNNLPNSINPSDILSMYANKALKSANEAKQYADEIHKRLEDFTFTGEFDGVKDIKEENGTLTVIKSDGTETTIKLVKSVNGEYADDKGNVVLPKEIEIMVLGDSKV